MNLFSRSTSAPKAFTSMSRFSKFFSRLAKSTAVPPSTVSKLSFAPRNTSLRKVNSLVLYFALPAALMSAVCGLLDISGDIAKFASRSICAFSWTSNSHVAAHNSSSSMPIAAEINAVRPYLASSLFTDAPKAIKRLMASCEAEAAAIVSAVKPRAFVS